jgi:hypothetical protein
MHSTGVRRLRKFGWPHGGGNHHVNLYIPIPMARPTFLLFIQAIGCAEDTNHVGQEQTYRLFAPTGHFHLQARGNGEK